LTAVKPRSAAANSRLLEVDEGAHVVARIAVGQVEHRVVQAVEAGQRDELELVAHGAELALELGDGGVVEVLLPVEGRRAVVGQHLAGELRVDGIGERLASFQVGLAGLAPDQVGVGRVGQAAAMMDWSMPHCGCGRSPPPCARRS
jgi:hypothetical protein